MRHTKYGSELNGRTAEQLARYKKDTLIERGDSLYDKSTNTLWLVVHIGAFQYQIENAKGERKAIDFKDVSNYKLIKDND